MLVATARYQRDNDRTPSLINSQRDDQGASYRPLWARILGLRGEFWERSPG